MDAKIVCGYVYPVCQHECGERLSPSEVHICPDLCQKYIICLDWSGHQVIRKCGEESTRIIARYADYHAPEDPSKVDHKGDQKNEKVSGVTQEDNNATQALLPESDKAKAGHTATTGHVSPIGSTEDKAGTSRDAQQPVASASSTTGKIFPVLHLKGTTSKTADSGRVSPVAGPSSRIPGRPLQHSEEMASSSASKENSDPFSFLWGQTLFEAGKGLIIMDGVLMDGDTAWKKGFAKCTNGHLFPGNLEFCDFCGAFNEFYFD